MAVRHETLNNDPKFQKFNNALRTASCGETDTSHILAGGAGWSIPYGEGCGNIWANLHMFTLGPSHPMSRNLVEVKEHLP